MFFQFMLRAKSPRYGTPVLQVYSSGVLCTLQCASDVVPRDAEHMCGQDRTPPTWRPPGIGIRIRIRIRAPRGTVTWEKARGHGSSTSTPRIRGNTPTRGRQAAPAPAPTRVGGVQVTRGSAASSADEHEPAVGPRPGAFHRSRLAGG